MVTFDVWGTLIPIEPAIKTVVDAIHKALGGRLPHQTVQALVNEQRRRMKLARREKHEVVPPIYTLLDMCKQLRDRGVGLFFDVHQVQDAIDDAISHLEVSPFEDAVEAIKLAKAEGYKVGIISNVLFWRSRATRKLLESLGISQLVDLQLYADDIGYVKPSVQVFEAAKMLLLGDAEPDVYLHVGDDFYEDFLGVLYGRLRRGACRQERAVHEEGAYGIGALQSLHGEKPQGPSAGSPRGGAVRRR